jgi:2-dehydropantoate 2-reductase
MSGMRYVVLGAGAIGGVIGGRLRQHGHDVVLIARGPHLAAIREHGLTIRDPGSTHTVAVDTVGDPEEVDWSDRDVVIMAVKGHQTIGALTQLSAVAPTGVAIVCAQNGIHNEEEALRRFPHVYGCFVGLPAAHLTPGLVESYSAPVSGILDLGRYPTGTDARVAEISAALNGSGFSSRVEADIMYWKRRKLVQNLANAVEAIVGPEAGLQQLTARAAAEGEACFAAAGLTLASKEEVRQRRVGVARLPIAGEVRKGNSSWQSLARGSSDIETDYLNGEIVLLGREYGVATPVNEALQRLARRMAWSGAAPGSMSVQQIGEEIGAVA